MGDLMAKIGELKLFDLWEQLYMKGALFGLENPKFVDITKHLMASRDHVYDRLMKKNLQLAKDFYIQMINVDKSKGLIREDLDSGTIADLLIETTTNVAIDHLLISDDFEQTAEHMKSIIKKRIDIFRKGIEIGE